MWLWNKLFADDEIDEDVSDSYIDKGVIKEEFLKQPVNYCTTIENKNIPEGFYIPTITNYIDKDVVYKNAKDKLSKHWVSKKYRTLVNRYKNGSMTENEQSFIQKKLSNPKEVYDDFDKYVDDLYCKIKKCKKYEKIINEYEKRIRKRKSDIRYKKQEVERRKELAKYGSIRCGRRNTFTPLHMHRNIPTSFLNKVKDDVIYNNPSTKNKISKLRDKMMDICSKYKDEFNRFEYMMDNKTMKKNILWYFLKM